MLNKSILLMILCTAALLPISESALAGVIVSGHGDLEVAGLDNRETASGGIPVDDVRLEPVFLIANRPMASMSGPPGNSLSNGGSGGSGFAISPDSMSMPQAVLRASLFSEYCLVFPARPSFRFFRPPRYHA